MKLQNYVAWDLEWHPQTGEIFCAAFVDDKGKEAVKHVADFQGDTRKLLLWAKMMLLRYPTNVGYYSTGSNSDIPTLNRNWLNHGIQSIINEERLIAEPFPQRKHVDLYRVFDKLMVKNYIYQNAYKSMKLEDVAQALLGEGKLGKGSDAVNMTPEECKAYCLQDARLTMKLSKAGKMDDKKGVVELSGELLDLMFAIGGKIDMPFEHVCHYGLTALWAHVFDHEEDAPAPNLELARYEPYEGGIVLDPKTGYYEKVIVVDVTSLYPTMAINYNISYETVNCKCCRNNPKARIPEEIIQDIRLYKTKNAEKIAKARSQRKNTPIDIELEEVLAEAQVETYWICQQRKGIFVKKLETYKADRVKEKRAGNNVASDGLKIMINGGYGAFGSEFFKYLNLGVAKLVPAFGRYIHRKMQAIALKHGFEIVNGDTDSLFLKGDEAKVPAFIAEVESTLEIGLEHEKTFKWLFMVGKKHYFGETTKGKLLIKGMEGMKDNMPVWINETFDQFVLDLKNGCDPLVLLQASWDMFRKGEVPLEKLTYAIKLSKNPENYKEGNQNRTLGQIANARAGDVVKYWKVKGGVAISGITFEDIDQKAYEESFATAFEEILNLMGKNITEITQGQTTLFSFQGVVNQVWPKVAN